MEWIKSIFRGIIIGGCLYLNSSVHFSSDSVLLKAFRFTNRKTERKETKEGFYYYYYSLSEQSGL